MPEQCHNIQCIRVVTAFGDLFYLCATAYTVSASTVHINTSAMMANSSRMPAVMTKGCNIDCDRMQLELHC